MTTANTGMDTTGLEQAPLRELLTRCVHCGFCNATCPTYLQSGEELEGPRGRITLIRRMADGGRATGRTLLHLDRCLTCLNCETTCPSGVPYRALIDAGRALAESQTRRPWPERVLRWLLPRMLASQTGLAAGLAMARPLRRWLPARLQSYLHSPRVLQAAPDSPEPATAIGETILLLAGCVQPQLAPGINTALEQILTRMGFRVVKLSGANCCGAMAHHLGQATLAHRQMQAVASACQPWLAAKGGPGVRAIVTASSGCGLMLSGYAAVSGKSTDQMATISQLTTDPLKLLEPLVDHLRALMPRGNRPTLVVHEPCTLQHGLKLQGHLPAFLASLGVTVQTGNAPSQCCGAGGANTLLFPALASDLRQAKRRSLGLNEPDTPIAVSANIGCMAHLGTREQPVLHWLEWLAGQLNGDASIRAGQDISSSFPSSGPTRPKQSA